MSTPRVARVANAYRLPLRRVMAAGLPPGGLACAFTLGRENETPLSYVNHAECAHNSHRKPGPLFRAGRFVTIWLRMVCASPNRSCCCLSNIFDGCPR